ncbi:hypothetical protein [Salinisphaera sp. T31B1]|uniref:hypothetical protein n=1 Tax=Salinisphaera sp. T31B1 TaxID=727963 RepID=UPI00334063B7
MDIDQSRSGHATGRDVAERPQMTRRGWLACLAGCLAVSLAGCAGGPQPDPSEPAYQSYWQCAYNAAMPYAADRALPARQAAMRAQAQCNGPYQNYVEAKRRYVQSVVPASDRRMADTMATQAALERRKMVTQRLTTLVAEAR